MICQFCGTKVGSARKGCLNCKPKIIHAEFEEPNCTGLHAKQIAIVISACGKEYAGYLPLRTEA